MSTHCCCMNLPSPNKEQATYQGGVFGVHTNLRRKEGQVLRQCEHVRCLILLTSAAGKRNEQKPLTSLSEKR
jgi:hypothetical protein